MQPCSDQLVSYESRALTWELTLPKRDDDLDESPNVGQYLLDGAKYGFAIFGDGIDFDTKPSMINVKVNNCVDSLCAYKDDTVWVYYEQDEVIYSILFSGTFEVQLDSDNIPDANMLAEMPVALEIFTSDYNNFLTNDGRDTQAIVIQ